MRRKTDPSDKLENLFRILEQIDTTIKHKLAGSTPISGKGKFESKFLLQIENIGDWLRTENRKAITGEYQRRQHRKIPIEAYTYKDWMKAVEVMKRIVAERHQPARQQDKNRLGFKTQRKKRLNLRGRHKDHLDLSTCMACVAYKAVQGVNALYKTKYSVAENNERCSNAEIALKNIVTVFENREFAGYGHSGSKEYFRKKAREIGGIAGRLPTLEQDCSYSHSQNEAALGEEYSSSGVYDTEVELSETEDSKSNVETDETEEGSAVSFFEMINNPEGTIVDEQLGDGYGPLADDDDKADESEGQQATGGKLKAKPAWVSGYGSDQSQYSEGKSVESGEQPEINDSDSHDSSVQSRADRLGVRPDTPRLPIKWNYGGSESDNESSEHETIVAQHLFFNKSASSRCAENDEDFVAQIDTDSERHDNGH